MIPRNYRRGNRSACLIPHRWEDTLFFKACDWCLRALRVSAELRLDEEPGQMYINPLGCVGYGTVTRLERLERLE